MQHSTKHFITPPPPTCLYYLYTNNSSFLYSFCSTFSTLFLSIVFLFAHCLLQYLYSQVIILILVVCLVGVCRRVCGSMIRNIGSFCDSTTISSTTQTTLLCLLSSWGGPRYDDIHSKVLTVVGSWGIGWAKSGWWFSWALFQNLKLMGLDQVHNDVQWSQQLQATCCGYVPTASNSF